CPRWGPRQAPAPPGPGARRWTGAEDERRMERILRGVAPPLALGLGFLAAGSTVVRLTDSMWLHELGHAITAWLSGFVAFPGPWRTSIAESRSPGFAIFVALALAGGGFLAWRAGKRGLAVVLGAVLLVQLVLTLGVRAHAAQALILFGGDGGVLVLGAALFASFGLAERGGHLQVSWLRWGFLALGAFGFADAFALWWRARKDPGVIPFGEIEGVGHSDPTRLVDAHGWSLSQLVGRYVA